MVYRTLKPEEYDSWIQHCAGVFNSESAEYFDRHYKNDPFKDMKGIFVAVDGDTIASTVRVFTREVYLGGKSVTMGGIGEVSTKLEYRRRGLSYVLLEMAVSYMRQKGFDVSFLFTGSHSHYEKHDWQIVERNGIVFQGKDKPGLDGGYIMREMQPNDQAAVRGIYGLSASRLDGVTVRNSIDYWDIWVAGEQKENKWVAVKDDKVVAYAFCRPSKEVVKIAEIFALPGYEGILGNFTADLCRQYDANAFIESVLLAPDITGELKSNSSLMVKLMQPINLNGVEITSTRELVEAMKNKTATLSVDAF